MRLFIIAISSTKTLALTRVETHPGAIETLAAFRAS
jgi:hypothetical protein